MGARRPTGDGWKFPKHVTVSVAFRCGSQAALPQRQYAADTAIRWLVQGQDLSAKKRLAKLTSRLYMSDRAFRYGFILISR